ncbi:MAG TPA: DUF58 domain-containing protein, partial [Acidimicrobiales bacterium]|nr:DUF58 domain-containing protein [Acidimicrobiales bacterium]
MSPTPRLVALLTLAAALTAVIGAAVGLPLALLAVVLGAVDARGVREAPVVTWQVPTVLARGRPATLSVSLTGGHGRRIVIRQPLPASLRAVPDRGVGSLESRLTGLRRGPVVLDGPVVRLEGRMGLARWTHSVPDKRSVKVLADMPGVRRLALEVRRGMRPAGARSGRRLVGLGTDFEAIREYQPDDDIRQVNWSASARAGRPMSNTYRVDQEREVVCLLDCGRLMAAPVGDRTRLDAAV